jgi:anti-sigma factor (TIGR02949 family)
VKHECQQALREIERFLDGEMGGAEHDKLDAHLHECPPCMDHAEFKRNVKQLIADRCGCEEMPVDLRHKVMSLLDAPPAAPSAEA